LIGYKSVLSPTGTDRRRVQPSLRRIRVSVWPLEVAIPQEAATLYLPDLF
jgi:hypothetical protein